MTPRSFLTLSISLSLTALMGCGGGSSSSGDAGSMEKPKMEAKSSVDPATAATVTGSVKFTGTKPQPKKISMSADAYCKGQHSETVLEEEVSVNPNGTLKNVYIFVKSGLQGEFPPSGEVVLDQIGCLYHPHVIAVQAGQDIVIKNSDSVLHNVNARPSNNKGFNIGQPVKGMQTTKTFDNPEVGIPVKCDVHPWMRSYINVQNHPYGVVTGDDGSFSLKNLPPGTYEIEAWHEKLGTSVQNVTVGAQETKSLTFTFKGA